MKKALITVLLCAASVPAMASVKLTNKDSASHDITIKCGSTVQTSIGSNVTRDIGSGSCTVTVKSTGESGSGSDGDSLVIKDGKVAKQ